MQYFFILGKNPELSVAELESVLRLHQYTYRQIRRHNNIAFYDIEGDVNAGELMAQLGGCIKLGGIGGSVHTLEEVPQLFFDTVDLPEKKVFFGFSLYALDASAHLDAQLKKTGAAGMEIKRRLRDEKQTSSRMVVSRDPALSAVVVQKNKMIDQGADIALFFTKDEIFMGKTLAVQEFEEFGRRDYGRPGRDDVSGMLPPKLARIMLNLAQAEADDIILDPFCGSGTVLQEALLLGYTHIIGSDLEEKAVDDTAQNIEWLEGEFGVDASGVSIIQSPAEQISRSVGRADAIVTEPFLGPPLRGNEKKEQLQKTIRSLEHIYTAAFGQFKKIVPSGGRVVMVFPAFKFGNQLLYLTIKEKIESFGFIPEYMNGNRTGLVYYREKQKLYREIWVFRKK